MTIEIRRATLDDLEEAARAHTASAEAAYRNDRPDDQDGLARRTRTWREILSNPSNQSFVAVDGGLTVGVLNIGPSFEDPSLGAVRILYVIPESWGSGAGQLLLDRAHAELAATFEEAQLTVLAANARARRFYERNGWKWAETMTEPHFGGVPTEVCRYHRRLP